MGSDNVTVKIRHATKDDARSIALLAHELAHTENRNCISSESTIIDDAFSDNPKCRFIVAELTDINSQQIVVGTAMYYCGYDLESASSGIHLGDIVVTKEYQRKGIGTKLMQHIAKIAQEEHHEWISWTMLNENKTAQKFYKKLGASRIPVCLMAMGKTTIHNLTKRD